MELFVTLLAGLAAGIVGAAGMNLFLRWVSSSFEEPVNMVKVLGSYLTGSLDRAQEVGTGAHLGFGACFGVLYALLIATMQVSALPNAFFVGLGLGFPHGLITSYGLMFFMSERHPIERYRKATFSIGLLYLIAHVVFGGVVGMLIGLGTLIS